MSGILPPADLIIKPISAGGGHRLRSMRWDEDSEFYRCNDPERRMDEAATYTQRELQHYLESAGVDYMVERLETTRDPLPTSSIRVLTLNVDGKSELICAAFLPAPDGSVSTAYFDLDTYLFDYERSSLDMPLHASSDGRYKGVPIPELQDVVRVCLEMHDLLPGHVEISWDVMLTDRGPVFLEGNVFPPGCDYKLSIFKSDENYNYLKDRLLTAV